MIRTAANTVFAALAAIAIGLIAMSAAQARIMPSRQHQFQQALLPSKIPGQYRVGLWVFNAANGRLRLCVLNEDKDPAPVMKCSPWAGEGPAGLYYLMQIRIRARSGVKARAGLWILNRRSGQARACVIRDMDDPTGSLRCSKVQ